MTIMCTFRKSIPMPVLTRIFAGNHSGSAIEQGVSLKMVWMIIIMIMIMMMV